MIRWLKKSWGWVVGALAALFALAFFAGRRRGAPMVLSSDVEKKRTQLLIRQVEARLEEAQLAGESRRAEKEVREIIRETRKLDAEGIARRFAELHRERHPDRPAGEDAHAQP